MATNSDAQYKYLAFDLDIWPTTLTHNPHLPKVKATLSSVFEVEGGFAWFDFVSMVSKHSF